MGEATSVQIVRQAMVRGIVAAILVVGVTSVLHPARCYAQDDFSKRLKSKVSPVYPEIARKMNLSGTVKLSVVVATNGAVKTTTAVGGHPILVNAAEDAVKKWKFQPASAESIGTVEIRFAPQN